MTFCEVKSGISVTGDKQSVELIQMLTVIKQSQGKEGACAFERERDREETASVHTWKHVQYMCTCNPLVTQY